MKCVSVLIAFGLVSALPINCIGQDSGIGIQPPDTNSSIGRFLQSYEPAESNFRLGKLNLSIKPPADLRTPALSRIRSSRLFDSTQITAIKPFCWTAPDVVHRNLIFEEPLLERHGLTRNELLQPVISGSRFYLRTLFLPVGVVTHQNRRWDSGLGWGVPGSNVTEACNCWRK